MSAPQDPAAKVEVVCIILWFWVRIPVGPPLSRSVSTCSGSGGLRRKNWLSSPNQLLAPFGSSKPFGSTSSSQRYVAFAPRSGAVTTTCLGFSGCRQTDCFPVGYLLIRTGPTTSLNDKEDYRQRRYPACSYLQPMHTPEVTARHDGNKRLRQLAAATASVLPAGKANPKPWALCVRQ